MSSASASARTELLSKDEKEWSTLTVSSSVLVIFASGLYFFHGRNIRAIAETECGLFFIERADGELFARQLLNVLYAMFTVAFNMWALWRFHNRVAHGSKVGRTGMLLVLLIFSLSSMLSFDLFANGMQRTYEADCGAVLKGKLGGADVLATRWSGFAMLLVCGVMNLVITMLWVSERVMTQDGKDK